MDEQNKEIEAVGEKKSSEDKDTSKERHGGLGEKREMLQTLIVTAIFVVAVVGGFASGCVRCTNCGNDDTRFFIYASGTSEDGIDYKSCVGPAGCLGFGINSKCWPTECLYVENASSSSESVSGCVTYYNEAGCIANSEVKSVGKYSDKVNCFGITCAGTKYVETVAETTKARTQVTCFGLNCGNSETASSRNYNSSMPRQFVKGCWSNN